MYWIGLEGIDGCGKTTQAKLLKQALEGRGHKCVYIPDPGGWTEDSRFKDLIFRQGEWSDLPKWDKLARRFLFMADYIQTLKHRIEPLVNEDVILISDRVGYISSEVYGKAEGIDKKILIPYLERVSEHKADVVFLLNVTIHEAEKRMAGRAGNNEYDEEDRVFKERLIDNYDEWHYWESHKQGYAEPGTLRPRPFKLWGNRSPDALHQEIMDILRLLPNSPIK